MTKELEQKLKNIALIIKQDIDTPAYLALENEIIRRIGLNILLPGDRLPTISEMGRFAEISRQTAYKTYQNLQDKGYVYMQRQNGVTIAILTDKKIALDICQSNLSDVILQAYASGLTPNDIHLCLDKTIATIDSERQKNILKYKTKGDLKQ